MKASSTLIRRFFRLSLILVTAPLVFTGCGGNAGAEGPDPGIVDYPIAYVKRPIPLDDNGNPLQEDIRDPGFFAAGSDLFIRTRATTSATETNITGVITNGRGDVRDIDVSPDGKKLAFSVRLEDTNPNDDIIPPWNLYEYNIETRQLRAVVTKDPEFGDDISPRYLPDGRIVFSSNRQAKSETTLNNEFRVNNFDFVSNGDYPLIYKSLDESRGVRTFNLHIVDDSGEAQQITFNRSHDLDPLVMPDGTILYVRWDNASGNNTGFSLYRVSPSGGNNQLVYGAHSHNTGTNGSTVQFTRPRILPNGGIIVVARSATDTFGGGDIWRIDIDGHVDHDRTITGRLATGGQVSISPFPLSTNDSLSLGGRYHDVFPLWDGTARILVSKGFCRLVTGTEIQPCTPGNIAGPGVTEAPPEYAIWMYDPDSGTEKFVIPPEHGVMYTDIVAIQSRPRPSIAARNRDDTLAAENWGLLHIRSVYDMDGSFDSYGSGIADLETMARQSTPASARPARFLRLIKEVPLPDPAEFPNATPPNAVFGPRRVRGMRQIIGYAPVEPDGSVIVRVPADTPFTIEILDAAGRRIGTEHRNWIQIPAGETLECRGCHQHPNDGSTPLPHGRPDAGPVTINPGNWRPDILGTNFLITFRPDETMAEARYRNCVTEGLTGCGSATSTAFIATPQLDLRYDDYWAPNAASANPAISLTYDDVAAVNSGWTAPTPAECRDGTLELTTPEDRHLCRSIINYPDHIEPLWSSPRTFPDGTTDGTCTSCHNSAAADGSPQVPAGQLNLGNYPANTTPANYPAIFQPDTIRSHSYMELLFRDNALRINTQGNLDYQFPVLDQDGNQVLDQDGNPVFETITVQPAMSANGARASYFMEKMTGTELNAGRTLGSVQDPSDPNLTPLNHMGLLTDAELRLIAEWLDMGAQYFNNPADPDIPR